MPEQATQDALLRIGAYTFRASTGELWLTENDDQVQRLGPQPAQLLALLASRHGALVSHEEIRSALWPDVHVEFDQSLHHCVRQLRVAFGDDAERARYIETLPKRGYRLCAEVSPAQGKTDQPQQEAPPSNRKWSRRSILTFVCIGIIVGVVAALVRALLIPGPTSVYVVIMPFVPPEGSAFPAETRYVADHLLSRLVHADGLRIVGPTTTDAYIDKPNAIELIRANEPMISYIINARFIADDAEPRMLAELIRTSDGAHVWVQEFRDFSSPKSMAATIADAVEERLVD